MYLFPETYNMFRHTEINSHETLKKLLWTLRCVKMSQPGAGGHIAGHVVGDDDVVVVQNNILPLLITAKHEERFDLKRGALLPRQY